MWIEQSVGFCGRSEVNCSLKTEEMSSKQALWYNSSHFTLLLPFLKLKEGTKDWLRKDEAFL